VLFDSGAIMRFGYEATTERASDVRLAPSISLIEEKQNRTTDDGHYSDMARSTLMIGGLFPIGKSSHGPVVLGISCLPLEGP
jgi:hypothetical protein